jgi:hypothetical protein
MADAPAAATGEWDDARAAECGRDGRRDDPADAAIGATGHLRRRADAQLLCVAVRRRAGCDGADARSPLAAASADARAAAVADAAVGQRASAGHRFVAAVARVAATAHLAAAAHLSDGPLVAAPRHRPLVLDAGQVRAGHAHGRRLQGGARRAACTCAQPDPCQVRLASGERARITSRHRHGDGRDRTAACDGRTGRAAPRGCAEPRAGGWHSRDGEPRTHPDAPPGRVGARTRRAAGASAAGARRRSARERLRSRRLVLIFFLHTVS